MLQMILIMAVILDISRIMRIMWIGKIIRNIICYKLTSMACIDFILCKFQLI